MPTLRHDLRARFAALALFVALGGLSTSCGPQPYVTTGNAGDGGNVGNGGNGAGGEPITTTAVTTTAAAGGTTPTEGCPLGSPCCGRPSGWPMCNDNGAPAVCNESGVLVQQYSPCSDNQGSYCQDGHCTCTKDKLSCIGNSVYRCDFGQNPGENQLYFMKDCPDYAKCKDGICQSPDPCNPPGAFSCMDSGTVQHCQPDANGYYVWVPTYDCRANGFANGCNTQGVSNPTKPQDLCQNACGLHDYPIQDQLCGAAPGKFCAVLVCSDNNTQLVPDHESCFPPGATCDSDEQCASCWCNGGTCGGLNVPILCPKAEKSGCSGSQ